ncbi:MAG: alpha/beta hydrolase [Rhodospirillaceae bacterium]|jgi:dienelactone hydrolase
MRRQAPRASQNWIFDNFIQLTDNEDILHPGIMGIRLERGFKFGDMERIFRNVTGRRAFPRAWAAGAARQEEMAEEALAAGHRVTAAQHFHRAAIYYGRAQHLIPVDGNAKKMSYHASVVENYDRLIELLDGEVSRHVVPFEDGKNIYCLFHKAPGDGPKPTVLYQPGMDAIKEDFPNPYNNEFTRRGMNICVMDGPGQGECNINQVWQVVGNYARAGSAVLDMLVERDDVDADKIAVFGTSMGSRYSVEIAAADPRVKAAVGQMANVGPTDVIFNQAQPNFKRIYMYMTNIYDEDTFDKYADEMDANFFASGEKLECPYLLVAGEMDELTPPEDVHAWLDRLNCPRELWMYQDVFHPMGEVAGDIYPGIADWISDVLEKGLPDGHDKRLEISP